MLLLKKVVRYVWIYSLIRVSKLSELLVIKDPTEVGFIV